MKRNDLIGYIQNNYGVSPEYPWDKYPIMLYSGIRVVLSGLQSLWMYLRINYMRVIQGLSLIS